MKFSYLFRLSYLIVTPIIVIELTMENIFDIFEPNDGAFTLNVT